LTDTPRLKLAYAQKEIWRVHAQNAECHVTVKQPVYVIAIAAGETLEEISFHETQSTIHPT
jgi:hypothetical protein